MAKRVKNIYKRKDGRWEGRYPNGQKENGRTCYSSVYGKSYFEVKRQLEEIRTHHWKNCIKISEKNLLFSDILELWLDYNSLKHKPATQLKYENLIKSHISPDLGRYKIQDVDEVLITAFLKKKSENGRLDGNGGLSHSYIVTMTCIIESAINYAVTEGLRSPLKHSITKPFIAHQEVPILTNSEFLKLEKEVIQHPYSENLGILITLNTGMRIGEICALRWSEIDMNQKIIHVRFTVSRVKNFSENTSEKTVLIIDRPKTRHSIRDIPITSKLYSALLKAKNRALSDYVISKKDTFVSPRTFEYRFHRILTKLGIRKINYHSLRHTFATRCIECGVDVKSLSEILGHANVNITLNIYVHSSMEQKREQLEKLNVE